jgi:hypothetical protein
MNLPLEESKKPLFSMGLMQCSPLVKLGERKNNYYSKTLPLYIIISTDDFLRYGNRVSLPLRTQRHPTYYRGPVET